MSSDLSHPNKPVHAALKALFLAVLFCIASGQEPALAGSPVWKITKGDRHLFIGGTVHVLSQSDYPLPAAFDVAYRQATTLVFETDIAEMQKMDFVARLFKQTAYMDGRNLKMDLSSATYRKMVDYLTKNQVPVESIVMFKPGMAAMQLTRIELQRLGLMGTGVDEFYSRKATEDGKSRGQLESADEQLRFITTMDNGKPDELIAYTLREMEKLPEMMQGIKDAWRLGDNAKLAAIAATPLKNEFPQVFDRLLVQRNNAWLPKIEAMLANDEVELVLVGALHLVGDEGLLMLLEQRGCGVRQQ